MAVPVAKIKIANGAFRLDLTTGNHFEDAAALRADSRHTTGDYAQIYKNKKIYVYNEVAGALGDDDGLTVIKPNDIDPDPNVETGRWLETTDINLTAEDSTPSLPTEAIVTYDWFLVSNPALLSQQPGDPGEDPIVTLIGSGQDIDVNIDTVSAWQAGGLLVFLQVTDTLNQQSLGNPYDATLNQDALFTLVLATENFGFRVPAAGSRNWQTVQNANMRRIDEALQVVATTGISPNAPTLLDKVQSPSVTAGAQSATGLQITQAPASGSYVRVFVNGIAYELGETGTYTARPCFFSQDGIPDTDIRDIDQIQAGDEFVWNGNVAGFELDTNDVVEFDYVRPV